MMNQTEIGKFIAKCRKEQKLTQAQLAEKLNITDRAVSKWKNGKSMPDSSIMLELCEILGITVNELLSGEKINMESNTKIYEQKVDENLIAMKRNNENNLTKNVIISILFSITLLTGIMACLIVNLAVSGKLTWSLIPVSSIVFAWVISFPGIIMGKKGIGASLISLSVFTIPYLYLLSRLVNVKTVFSIGTATAIASIAFLWLIFIVFNRIGKTKKLFALGVTFLLAIPFLLIINAILAKMIEEPIFDAWDMLTIFILLILAFIAFLCNYAKKKGLLK